MKKKKVTIISLCASVVIALLCVTAFAGLSNTPFDVGKLFKDGRSASEIKVAQYKDFTVTKAEVEYAKSAESKMTGDSEIKQSDREITDRLIKGYMVLCHAKEDGYEATDEEIANDMETLKASYNEHEDAKEIVDNFCKGAEITIEEYWQQVEQQTRDSITRNKFKYAFYESYAKEIGYDGSLRNSVFAGEAEEKYEGYLAELLEEQFAEVEYFD